MMTVRAKGLFTIAALCLVVFIAVGATTAGEPGLEWERRLIVWLRSAADPAQWSRLAYLARDLTALGGRTLLLLWVLGAAALLWAGRVRHGALFVLASGTTGLGLAVHRGWLR